MSSHYLPPFRLSQEEHSELLHTLTLIFPKHSMTAIQTAIKKFNGDKQSIMNYLNNANAGHFMPSSPGTQPFYTQNRPLLTPMGGLQIDVRQEALPSGDDMYDYVHLGTRPTFTVPPQRSITDGRHIERQKEQLIRVSKEVARLKRVKYSLHSGIQLKENLAQTRRNDPSFPTTQHLQEVQKQCDLARKARAPPLIVHTVSAPGRPNRPNSGPPHSPIDPNWVSIDPSAVTPVGVTPNDYKNGVAALPTFHCLRVGNQTSPNHSPRSNLESFDMWAQPGSPQNIKPPQHEHETSPTWPCLACTMENNGLLELCEICGASRKFPGNL